jgi:hypothetical protein
MKIHFSTAFVATASLLLLIGSAMPAEGAQSDVDARIKQLEAVEKRLDAKIKRLEELEAHADARLGGASGPADSKTASAASAKPSPGSQWGGQVSFRGGYTHLDRPAVSGAFTGPMSEKGGYMVGAALDVPLMKDPWLGNSLLGQISMDFSGMAGRTQFAITGERGKQSLFKIAVSPKYRLDNFGEIRPWIIPIGLSFLVNSPPSNSAGYLTVGGTTGAGAEYVLLNRFALGVAFSYNFFSEDRNRIATNHFSAGPYLGINF